MSTTIHDEIGSGPSAMKKKLVVLRNGEPIFEYSIDPDQDGLVEGAKVALSEFRRLHPSIGLFDPEISIRFEDF